MNLLISTLSAVVSDTVNPDNVPDGYGRTTVDSKEVLLVVGIFVLAVVILWIIFALIVSRKELKEENKQLVEKIKLLNANFNNHNEELEEDEREILRKYKELLDDNLITQEDYEKKKKQILNI